ncbi:MAG: Asp-tRNA(Asn)/Glu-tRNA(Gln) amidotransferase GatCAB subunit A [Blastocatellia bacterium AA13]|nr:MAG: Asp-tRNA(Asn)/Glu-tRNA(Gln) amidotransferase GatCAB subunit A [Blastocatellia bacterium AA13]
MDLREFSIKSLREELAAGRLKASDVCRTALERMQQLADLNAVLTVMSDSALARADELDLAAQRGDSLPPLAGTMLAVKDVIVIEGTRATGGSRILYNYIPPYTATAVKKLEAAGAIVVGKTNCDEFAMGSSTENSAYGTVKNPWDTARVPGGSSGGSAVVVSAGMTTASLGSDTGGSIRQPAGFCGVVGLKPTYGRVSRYGLMSYGSSLDHIGPFANRVEDAAEILKAIAGHDPCDSTSSRVPVPDYVALLQEELRGLKVGVPREYFGEGLDPEVKTRVEAAINKFEELGAGIIDISLPHTEYAVPVYYLIATAEASSNLARYDGVRYGFRAETGSSLREMYCRTRDEGFGAEVKRRIMLGTYALSAGYYDQYYGKAQKVRSLIDKDFREAFSLCDIIATPVAPTTAFEIGELIDDPLKMYLQDIYTVTVNLAGVPAIVLPCGASTAGLPIGIQLIGPHFEEARLLTAAHNLERVIGFNQRPSAIGKVS